MTPDELRSRLAAHAALISDLTDPLLEKLAPRNAALQLRSSSTSAAANHRAAGRARSHREFTSKLGEALEEADESCFWLEHLVTCRFLKGAVVMGALDESRQLVAILTKGYSTSKERDEQLPPAPRRRRRRRT
jgi:four helix bundle protein